MIEIKPRINLAKVKKRKTERQWSFYRDQKSAGHRTIGGVGEIARLRGKGRKQKKSPR